MEKLTPWFHGSVRPVRRGVYQRKFGDTVRYSMWDGEQWCIAADSAKAAEYWAGTPSPRQPDRSHSCSWRGLTERAS